MTAAERLTAKDMLIALHNTYADRFAMLTEMPAIGIKEGFVDRADWQTRSRQPDIRYIDVLLIAPANSKPPHERIAIEIKVTRADFRRDTEEKRGWWQQMAHRFAYAVPAGLVTKDEVPPGCGLIEVGGPDQWRGLRGAKWTVRAPRRTEEPEPMSAYLVHYIARRAARVEARLKGHDWESRSRDDDPVELHRRITELQAQVQAAQVRADAALTKYGSIKRLMEAMEPQVCAHCEQPIRPRLGRGQSYGWVHRDPAAEPPCKAAFEAREAERDDAERTAAGLPVRTRRYVYYDVYPKTVAELAEGACAPG